MNRVRGANPLFLPDNLERAGDLIAEPLRIHGLAKGAAVAAFMSVAATRWGT